MFNWDNKAIENNSAIMIFYIINRFHKELLQVIRIKFALLSEKKIHKLQEQMSYRRGSRRWWFGRLRWKVFQPKLAPIRGFLFCFNQNFPLKFKVKLEITSGYISDLCGQLRLKNNRQTKTKSYQTYKVNQTQENNAKYDLQDLPKFIEMLCTTTT